MIYVDRSQCDGCGDCLDTCTMGAISMQDQRAFIDEKLCAGCAACQSVCPQNAIIYVEVIEPSVGETEAPMPAPLPTQTAPVQQQPNTPAMRDLVMPAISSLVLWTGKEIVPRLERLVLEALDRKYQSAGQAPAYRRMRLRGFAPRAQGRGHRRHLRRRHRGSF